MVEAGATDAAMIRVAGAMSMDDKFPEARKLLGKLLWEKKQFREAVEQWQQVLAITPEDEEAKNLLAKAKRQLKLRTVRIIAALIAVVVIFMFALFVPTYISFKSINMHLEQVSKNNVQLAELQQQVKFLEKQQENLAADISDIMETNKREIADIKTEIKVKLGYLSQSLVPLLESIRPANAEIMAMRIQKLQNKQGELHGLEEKYQSRNLFIIDFIARAITGTRLKLVETEMKPLQDKYQKQVVPWEQALKTVKELTDKSYGTESSGESNQR
ncbi:MAG: tetratricopeptide repeat protein [Phycisphaerae bacterium]|jgi:tetratricopeptide (TPR) repeat protein